jgi:paraquat-inducible protein A
MTTNTDELIACHEYDHLYRCIDIDEGTKANCSYCGSLLYRNIPGSLDRSLAFYITALILFVLANTFPFISLEFGGRVVESILFSSGWALYEQGMGELGLLVFLTSIGFPLLAISGMLYLLIPIKLGYKPHGMGAVYRVINAINPWGLISVFMLAVIISIVKLQDLANVIIGTALFALTGLLVIYAAARASFEPRLLWAVSDVKQADLSAAKGNILNCHTCAMLSEEKPGHNRCKRCGTPLHHRKHDSINRTWALLAAATILLIPANVYPVLTVIRFGQGAPDTILTGILHLIEDGMWGLGLIVFVASIVVPVLKLIVLSFLLLSVQKKLTWRPRDRTLLYRITEVVGAWSMVDVFLVGMLASLVTMGSLSTIIPGIGASFFGGVVVITMFAAMNFDPRLIWDNLGDTKDEQEN